MRTEIVEHEAEVLVQAWVPPLTTNHREDENPTWQPDDLRETISYSMGHPPAGTLTRYPGNPVLQPVDEHPWESRYVLNAAAIAIEGKVYLVYRAYGDDKVSRLGLAVSEDGFNFNERLDEPIFEPGHQSEARGCEDPRLTGIGERIYMAYTAYDGAIPQIALASIGVTEFTKYRWDAWVRHGLFLPGCVNKDAALFPELFDGRIAMLHRIEPHIWITFADSTELRCPWPGDDHRILAEVRTGMLWDSKKIGAGTQPIKTKYGWLLITHGVDHNLVYRLGVMVLDLEDPARLIYRSPNFVLEPETEWEMGGDDASWVPNVVFTCGAIPRGKDKETLDADDELIVYYGASDTVIAVATARVGDLIPEAARR
ncbi:MAG: glycosidase [Chloroflexi bacterium]|nr:glycosidase [Chloroflexota bacterium]